VLHPEASPDVRGLEWARTIGRTIDVEVIRSERTEFFTRTARNATHVTLLGSGWSIDPWFGISRSCACRPRGIAALS
jgi:hypothetical protein